MKLILGALALAVAVPASAQTAKAADPHAAHAGKSAQAGHDGHRIEHAQMMAKCKEAAASADIKAHCAMMSKEHGQHAPASPRPKADHGGHAH